MATDLNRVFLIGRLGRDVELKTMNNGDVMARFSLAVGESYTSKNGEKVKNTQWINLVCYRKLAEICSKYLGKGSQVFVSGKLSISKYIDKEGIEKQSTQVIINEMQMLGSKQGHENDPEPKKVNEESADDEDLNMDIPF